MSKWVCGPNRFSTTPIRLRPTPRRPWRSPGFEAFFREAWPGAVRLACFLTSDRTAGEEIAQDAFTQMYATWGRAESPEAYLRTTIVNRCSNWRRHLKVRQAKASLLATRR